MWVFPWDLSVPELNIYYYIAVRLTSAANNPKPRKKKETAKILRGRGDEPYHGKQQPYLQA